MDLNVEYPGGAIEYCEKLKFFHLWSFYEVYNAQNYFYERLLDEEFSFTFLFGKVIRLLKKDNRKVNGT
jgi:hypothetical protein